MYTVSDPDDVVVVVELVVVVVVVCVVVAVVVVVVDVGTTGLIAGKYLVRTTAQAVPFVVTRIVE